MTIEILLAHNYLALPAVADKSEGSDPAILATVLANMAHYGFVPSVDAVDILRRATNGQLMDWWPQVESAFEAATGADRDMGEFVVYKNFPGEVLAMSEAQYWTNQIFIYLGAPVEWFAEPAAERPKLDERLRLRVLQPAGPETLRAIFNSLMLSKARWTQPQASYANDLVKLVHEGCIDLSSFGFKENGLRIIASNPELEYRIVDATDVARLAAALSEQDVSLRQTVKFARFGRAMRRRLLASLEQAPHLTEDVARRPELFKKLFASLHPGDYAYGRVSAVYDQLYRGQLVTHVARVEAGIAARDPEVLALVATEPGDFVRRLHKLYAVFGAPALGVFATLLQQLATAQLLKLRSYLSSVNDRSTFLYAPRGNWSKLQVVEKTKTPFADADLARVVGMLDGELAARLNPFFPEGVEVALEAVDIKLQTNDQELAPYGRGTVFHLPEGVRFLRTSSYWEHKSVGHNWFDNGWNFFDDQWKPLGACCWHEERFQESAAIYAGDPANGTEESGRACELIDLNLEQLVAAGVRYAVWGVLAYSRVAFSEAHDVLATLQWGEDAEAGELFEPARAQMVFPLRGNSLAKYVAYLDLAERKLVYMDANLPASVSAASANGEALATQMPAFVEYLKSLPSVADLFANVNAGKVPVLYSDEGKELEKGAKAYVFRPTNPENSFEQVDLQTVLR